MNPIMKWTAATLAGGLLVAGVCLAQEAKDKKRLSDDELVAALGKHMDELVKADKFSGVVLLARDGKPLFRQAYGMADRGLGVANNPETKFNIGSIGKLFTRVAIEQLAEQGKLALDDTLAKHLPDYPNPEVAAKITIRQLLEFKSGLGDIFTPEFRDAAKDRFRSPRDWFAVFAHHPLQFEPGTSQKYSNAGYVVLGAIVEAVSGKSYDDYVREHIFQPAGMTGTGAFDLDDPVANRAVGYTRRNPRGPASDGGRRSNLFLTAFKGSPAGGGYSTVDDMLRLDAALRSGLFYKDGRKIVGIGAAGGTAGCNALLEQIDEHHTLIVLANYDPPVAEKLGETVRGWMGISEDGEGVVVRRRP
ncbi:MAG TPA: serine hydrolase domain-containing protein [Thermoanaerobaculia bacterium]